MGGSYRLIFAACLAVRRSGRLGLGCPFGGPFVRDAVSFRDRDVAGTPGGLRWCFVVVDGDSVLLSCPGLRAA